MRVRKNSFLTTWGFIQGRALIQDIVTRPIEDTMILTVKPRRKLFFARYHSHHPTFRNC